MVEPTRKRLFGGIARLAVGQRGDRSREAQHFLERRGEVVGQAVDDLQHLRRRGLPSSSATVSLDSDIMGVMTPEINQTAREGCGLLSRVC